MELSNLTINGQKLFNELENTVGFELKKEIENNKFMIMSWKWVVKVNDFELYNKFADKLGGEIAKSKYERKSFSYDFNGSGSYNFWFNI